MLKRNAFIFDIDGTLALKGGRFIHDEKRVLEDHPNMPVIKVLNALAPNYVILTMSGRHETCRADTERWLRMWLGFVPALFMRAAGDNRKDSIVKEELYREYVLPDYNVIGVFDDRNQVVSLWRSLGLTCFQVADGAF